MSVSQSAVVQAFLVDHRKLMKLLQEVSAALDSGEIEQASQLGEQLNRIAGPHIAFEESVLYPALEEKTHEREFVAELYAEHQSIIAALELLLRQTPLAVDALAEAKAAFREGLEHAEHCGTFISRLTALDETDRREALDELVQLRSSGIKWTDLKKES